MRFFAAFFCGNEQVNHVEQKQQLACMLYNTRYQFPIRDHSPQHLWNGLFRKYAILFSNDGQADVNAATLRRCDFSVERLLRQVNLSRICRIELDHWS